MSDAFKRSPAKKIRPTAAESSRQSRPYQAVGEPLGKTCPEDDCGGGLLLKQAKNSTFVVCDRGVYKDPTTCQFAGNRFRADRDPTKPSKINCLACVNPVSNTVSIGKLVEEPDEDGRPRYENLHVFFEDCAGKTVRNDAGELLLCNCTNVKGDIVGTTCVAYIEGSTFTDLRDGCTGPINDGATIVRGWCEADEPEGLHIRCAKRLWQDKRNEILSEKRFQRKAGTTSSQEAKAPSASLTDDLDDL